MLAEKLHQHEPVVDWRDQIWIAATRDFRNRLSGSGLSSAIGSTWVVGHFEN